MPDETEIPADDLLEDDAEAAKPDDEKVEAEATDTPEDDAKEADDVEEDAASSPFDEFGDPTERKAKAEEEPATKGEAEPDELDKRLAAAETALEEDPGDPDALRKYTQLNREVRERDAKERKQLAAQVRASAEEAAYDQFERTCGLHEAAADVRKKLNRQVVKERFQKHFAAELKASGGDASEARGAARATLRHEIKQIIAAAGTTRQAPKSKRTDTGATLSPPGGGHGGRTAKAQPKPENVFIDGNWSYPNVDPGA